MAVEEVTYEEAKHLALTYYIGVQRSMPMPFRDMPRKKVANQTLSINDIVAAIQSNSDAGVWLVGEYVAGMGLIVVT